MPSEDSKLSGPKRALQLLEFGLDQARRAEELLRGVHRTEEAKTAAHVVWKIQEAIDEVQKLVEKEEEKP